MEKIAVIGLGYVGLPLSLLADEKSFEVVGIDSNKKKIELLNKRISPIKDVDLSEKIRLCSVNFTNQYDRVKGADIILICVPTPVRSDKMPDLTLLKEATASVSMHISPNTLIILESTVNPGVCEEIIIPIVEEISGMKVGKNVQVAHCPERINPGDPKWSLRNISRVVGSNSSVGLHRATEFYQAIIDAAIKPMGNLKEAEAVKIVENSFRDINIAFVNELAKSFHHMGINLENVIDGAATKPFAFMPHRPGCGVGGHCIPVDPYYLIEHAKGFGFEHKFLQLARDINESMPGFTIELLESSLDKVNLDKKKAKILILGQAYKADIEDYRESPAIKIYSKLVSMGYLVKRYDPYILHKSDFDSLKEALNYANAVIIGTSHSEFKEISPGSYGEHSIQLLIDGRNIHRDSIKEFSDLGIHYRGIGITS